MKMKMKMKRAAALALSAALVLGLVPQIAGTDIKAYAATNETPSVMAYATPDELMNTYATSIWVGVPKIGLLNFGKNESGSTQKWYILGRNEDISGSNTIIFAADTMFTSVFQSVGSESESSRPQYGFNTDITYIGASPAYDTRLWWNNYGLSKLRKSLKSMAIDTSFFSATEQGLLQATQIATYCNALNCFYTTTDKLYIPDSGRGGHSTDDSTCVVLSFRTTTSVWDTSGVINNTYYTLGSTAAFWVRSPYNEDTINVHAATAGGDISKTPYRVENANAVRPAAIWI